MPAGKGTTPFHIWKDMVEREAIKAGGNLTGEHHAAKDRRLMELFHAGHSADIAGMTLARESHSGYETKKERPQQSDVREHMRSMMSANASAGGSGMSEAKGEWHPYGNPNAKGMSSEEKAQRVAKLLMRAKALREP